MRSIIFIAFLTVCSLSLCAQGLTDREMIIPWYQNVGYMNDSIESVGYSFQRGLFFGFESTQSLRNIKIPKSLSLDSNSYSEVDFKIGNSTDNPNQSIGISLRRPISRRIHLNFSYQRASNAGWIDHSFYRSNKVNLGLSYRMSKRVTLHAQVQGNNQNVETNFGIIDSTQFSILQKGSDIGLAANTRVLSASSSLGEADALLSPELHLVNKRNAQLSFILLNGAHYTNYKFSDPTPDATAYQSIGLSQGQSIRDSSYILGLFSEPTLAIVKAIDSALTLELFSSIRQQWYLKTNNGSLNRPINQSSRHELLLQYNRLSLDGYSEYYIQGYNKDNFNWKAEPTYRLWNKVLPDSNQSNAADLNQYKRPFLDLFAVIDRYYNRPGLVYTNYTSDAGINRNTLNNINRVKYSLGSRYSSEKLGMRIKGDYEILKNFTYLDRYSQVRQIARNIEVIRFVLDMDYHSSNWTLSTSIVRQLSNDINTHVPMPRWINRSSIHKHWSVFSKRLLLTLGGRSLYYTGYFARSVNPVFNMLQVQNSHNFGNYFQCDVFTYVNIKSLEIGVYLQNALYGIVDDNPMIAPHYSSMPRNLMLNINWKFKN